VIDVAVVGGGVIGCSILRALSRYRVRALLLERAPEVGFGISKSNSGIVHAGHQTPPDRLKGRFDVRGNALFDALARELAFGFRRIGALVVARDASEWPALVALRQQGEAKGVPGLELWDAARLRQAEPNLSPALAGALHAPTAGVVNPYELCFALAEDAAANGAAVWTDTPVEGLEAGPDALTLRTPRGPVAARFVLNCAGLQADRLAGLLGLREFTLRPRKGEEYLLDRRLQGLVRRIVYPLPTPATKGTLIIPTYDGPLMVGPTAEDQDDREDVGTTRAGAEQVFAAVRRLCPAIGPGDTIAEFAGLRAVADTDDFVIGPTAVRGFLNVAGIQSPGLTAAPAIAEHVCDLLRAEGLRLEPRDDLRPPPPAPVRLAALPEAEQRRLIEADRAFARVVCRCELVTEGEVQAAIDRGARTLDGLKFRTRAGMGRCQGAFCTPRCLQLLARRLGRPLAAVTKRGPGSWVVLPREDPEPAGAAGRA
jgi:glycerol-3-phosphate dehydrogenase